MPSSESAISTESPVLAEVVRSGFTESRHRGRLVGLGRDGQPVLQAGPVDEPVFPRSSNKPMQATAMIGCGLDLNGKLLALAAASHSGEDYHVAGAREILASAGLDESALQCPVALPMDEPSMYAMIRRREPADRLHMNCSGKHAAMLATCVAAGWPTGSYRDPSHPLQLAIRRTLERLAGEPVAATGVDGCGAPVLAISVSGVARAFRSMLLSNPGSPERRVADAMRSHPDWTSGSTRPERALMEAVPGLLLKSGAEGVEGFALPDGRAGAFKIDDGAHREVVPLAVTLLRALGADQDPGVDAAALDRLARVDIKGADDIVGEIRIVI